MRSGTVWIRARPVDDGVAITVADDGEGFNVQSTGTGIGLKNIRERLQLVFSGKASLAVVANFPSGVAATITVPAANPAANSTSPPTSAPATAMPAEDHGNV